jgi:hypothetical protein
MRTPSVSANHPNAVDDSARAEAQYRYLATQRERQMITTALPHVAEARPETLQTSVRELDHRTSAGIEVTLRWDPLTNRISVVVRDERHGESFAFGVDPADALCAFHHPYAYAANLPEPRAAA